MSSSFPISDALILSGEHAALEPMQQHHIDDLNAAAADGELWNLQVTQVPDSQKMPTYVDQALQKRARGSAFPFVIRRLADGKIVGTTRYYYIKPEHQNLSIGFTWYAKSAQRTAINTECKLMLLRYAFEELGCISVAFHVDDTNLISQAAVERLGATREGILRNHMVMPDGRIRHTHCFSITDAEWPAIKDQLSKRLSQSS